jgi:hypothetical protein
MVNRINYPLYRKMGEARSCLEGTNRISDGNYLILAPGFLIETGFLMQMVNEKPGFGESFVTKLNKDENRCSDYGKY